MPLRVRGRANAVPRRDRSKRFHRGETIFKTKKSKSACARRASAPSGCGASTKSSTARLAPTVFAQHARTPRRFDANDEIAIYFILRRSPFAAQRAESWASIARDVLRGWLNCSDSEIDELKATRGAPMTDSRNHRRAARMDRPNHAVAPGGNYQRRGRAPLRRRHRRRQPAVARR